MKARDILFARLGVFAGGWALPAAEAVCNAHGDLPLVTMDGVASLLEKDSLVQWDRTEAVEVGDDRDREPRFTMLETIREYALELLSASGEANAVNRWHAEFYLALAEMADHEPSSSQREISLNQLEQNHDNLRAAFNWSIGQGEWEIAARFCVALLHSQECASYIGEGRAWVEKVLREGTLQPYLHAKVLSAQGVLALTEGDYLRRPKRQ